MHLKPASVDGARGWRLDALCESDRFYRRIIVERSPHPLSLVYLGGGEVGLVRSFPDGSATIARYPLDAASDRRALVLRRPR